MRFIQLTSDMNVKAAINIAQIEEIRPTNRFIDGKNTEITMIRFVSGQWMNYRETYDEVDKIITAAMRYN